MADTLPELKAQIDAAEAKYGDLPKGLLEKLAAIESKGGRSLVNPKSSARGPFQFMKDTGPEFGLMTEADRMDFAKSTDAAARLLLRNKKDLERQLGRPATAGELYLAHQQGATGAARLLKNSDKLAADVVGDPEKIRLNGGDPATMTAGAFATKWTSKIDGGAATAPAKKSALASVPAGLSSLGVTSERDFYDFNGGDIAKLDANTSALGRLGRETPKVDKALSDVPVIKVNKLSEVVRGTPEQAADRMESPADQPRSRRDTAILQGLSVAAKTASRLAQPLSEITPVEDTVTAPSGIPGTFSKGIESGLQNINADQQYFGAIIDTLTGNEVGAKSRIANAQQFEADAAQALAGIQSFEQFINEPTFDGFISQVVSASGQVAPSALDSIASALMTGGMYTLAKTGLSTATRTVARTLIKDMISKKAKGAVLDKAEDGVLDALYKNFKAGAVAGAFGSEYRMMSGSAFSEFGDAGADMNAENALKSLLIGAPQAALGVGGEYAILKTLGSLATKKATRSAETSILKKFAQDVVRTGVKSGFIEGATEVGQEGISVMQRAAIDPEFTLQDAQLRIGQAAFAGFFGGGVFGSGAAIPSAGISAARSGKILDNAKKLLKDASDARVETEVQNETTGVDDMALGGAATPEASTDVEAQAENMLNAASPKAAAFASIDPNTPPAVDEGKIAQIEIEDGPHKGTTVTVGHVPGKGLIIARDPAIVDEVMTTYELGGDVDAAIGEAISYASTKDGDQAVRVRNAEGAVVDEAVTNEADKPAALARAEEIAATVPDAAVDVVPVEQAMEDRNRRAVLDRKEFNAEASALLAMREMLEAEDDKAMDEKSAAPEIKSKSMKLGDEPGKITPEEQAQLNEITDPEAQTTDDSTELSVDEQLAQTYAEIDKEAAVRIEQYNERTTNRDPAAEKKNQATIDKLWLALAQVTPDEAQFAEYSKYKDRMPIKMLEKLIELNQINNEDGGLAYYDVAEDAQAGGSKKLSITQRDPFPNAETTVTREAVRDVLKQVENMPDPKSVLRKTEGKARAPSMFWLVNRRTGKAFRLNGTPKTKNAKGRTGIDALAQAGVALNARIGKGPQGKGMTKAQARSQGLMSMLGALAEAGYDLKVGKYPTGLVPFDQNKLDPTSSHEIVSNVDGTEYTINELLDVKPPLDLSKSDPDASVNREQLSDFNIHTAQVTNKEKTKVVTQETMTDAWASQPEQFAAAEDKKKKLNNVEDQLADAAKEQKVRREAVDEVVSEAVERGLPEMIEAELEPLPDGVTVTIKKVGKGWQAVVSGPNMERKTVTSRDKAWVEARAHALAVKEPDTNPLQYNRLALETTDAIESAREKHPEILGVPAAKDQSSIKDTGKTSSGTNKIVTLGNIGKLTGRVLSMANSMFNFHKPLTIMTLAHLKSNFDSLTSDKGKFARARDTLATVIDSMDDPATDSPAHALIGGQYLIVLRDEPMGGLDLNGDDILAPDDAKIAAVLAHEIGHLVFEQEYESQINNTPLKRALWDAYLASRKALEEERGTLPEQYTKDKAGFEEWYSDQVMAYVYNESRQVKGLVGGYFKRLANALREFFNRVNDALGGRLKVSRANIATIRRTTEDGKVKQGGTFADYMDQVVARTKAQRSEAVNNALHVDEQMQIKKMVLNLQNRLPAGAQRRMQTAARAIMSSGTWGRVGHGLMNILQASTDFMGLKAHGEGGANLKTFFGTLSQSMDKLGWNKRELFQQNRWNNKLADIFGFNDKTDPKEWDSQRTRSIMIEAMDESIVDANLSTPEAKAIRNLYKEIETTYLKKPGGARAGYYIPNFQPRANYGGPRMWNVDKIAKNEAAFIAWLQPKIRGDAQAVYETITRHTKNPVKKIEDKVESDIQNAGRTNVSPAERATMEFILSTNESPVTEIRDKVLRDARRGKYTMGELLTELQRAYPTDAVLNSVQTNAADGDIADVVKRYWLESTRTVRLTPGMDPALERKLAAEVSTIDAYNADPNDPNGWLLPPALAHSQYMHYIARRVEFEKMGIERGAQNGVKYVIGELDKIPEQYRHQVDEAIMANLGKFGENMGNGWRAINSVASVLTVFTTLLFTTLTSVTDFAGIAMRSKDFNQLGGYINGLKTTLTDREFQELARAVGTVTGRTQEHMMIGQGELDYANKTARSMTDAFFRYTGLEFYTKFVRSMAVGMGREFIINTALKQEFGTREERYLAELGLTREDVRNWLDQYQMFETPHGEKVRTAIARFADEAIIRPDASQRPTWASNPYLQMVWQLKSYYYGFGKTVLGGMGREMKNRYSEDGDFSGAATTAMLYASTIIPLTMFGMASRDWLKWLFQLAIPGVDETPSTSMKLDTTGYMWEIFKRSGTMGPFALGLTTMEAFKFEGIAAPFTANVPMFDLFDDTIFDGDLSRPLPVINNIK